MTAIKLRERFGGNDGNEIVELDFFMGYDEEHMNHVGTLHLQVGEYQLLGAAILLGARQTHGQLQVVGESADPPVRTGR